MKETPLGKIEEKTYHKLIEIKINIKAFVILFTALDLIILGLFLVIGLSPLPYIGGIIAALQVAFLIDLKKVKKEKDKARKYADTLKLAQGINELISAFAPSFKEKFISFKINKPPKDKAFRSTDYSECLYYLGKKEGIFQLLKIPVRHNLFKLKHLEDYIKRDSDLYRAVLLEFKDEIDLLSSFYSAHLSWSTKKEKDNKDKVNEILEDLNGR